MDDAQLVADALAGDRNAYAAIYDRYADRVHDFGASMLRNRADASDALQETFLVAFEILDQLAEPARLQSWLYAIAHRIVIDRVADQGGSAPEDIAEAAWSSDVSEERLSRAELAEFVWQAAAGLKTTDRALLDLHLRQGLEGRELASAAGVAPTQVDSRVERLESQTERSLGALLVARTGRRSCPGLAPLLAGWDGRLTAEFRDQVTAHVDDCETCNSRRRIAPSPLGLLASAPLAAAPAYLRGVVLGKAELDALEREGTYGASRVQASAGWAFLRDGFPDLGGGDGRPRRPTGPTYVSTRPGDGSTTAPTRAMPVAPMASPLMPRPNRPLSAPAWSATSATAATTRLPAAEPGRSGGYRPPEPPDAVADPGDDRDRRGMLVGGLAGLIILIAAVVIFVSGRSKGPSGTLGVGLTTSTVSTATSDTTVATTTVAIVPSTVAAPTTTLAVSGHLVVGGPKTLDLGTSATNASVVVGNDGQASLDFVVTATGIGLTVNPISGTLASGASQTLMVAFDRTSAPPGPFTGALQVSGGTTTTTINITAVVDPGPMIVGETSSPALVYSSTACTHPTTSAKTTTATVSATLTSATPLKLVVLHWQSTIPNGTGTATMAASGTTYSGVLGPYSSTQMATVDWWITAIDQANATSTSSHHSLPVITC